MTLKRQGRGCGLDYCGQVWGPVAGLCEHGNEPFDSTEGGAFLEKLTDSKILRGKKTSLRSQ
jgi:hypothetical protein